MFSRDKNVKNSKISITRGLDRDLFLMASRADKESEKIVNCFDFCFGTRCSATYIAVSSAVKTDAAPGNLFLYLRVPITTPAPTLLSSFEPSV